MKYLMGFNVLTPTSEMTIFSGCKLAKKTNNFLV